MLFCAVPFCHVQRLCPANHLRVPCFAQLFYLPFIPGPEEDKRPASRRAGEAVWVKAEPGPAAVCKEATRSSGQRWRGERHAEPEAVGAAAERRAVGEQGRAQGEREAIGAGELRGHRQGRRGFASVFDLTPGLSVPAGEV